MQLQLTAGLYSIFSSPEALAKYNVSEEHVKVVTENVRPNTEGDRWIQGVMKLIPDIMAYDFELNE